jgi:hypothetical protein
LILLVECADVLGIYVESGDEITLPIEDRNDDLRPRPRVTRDVTRKYAHVRDDE